MDTEQLLTCAMGLLERGDINGVIDMIARAEASLPEGGNASDPLRIDCELVRGHARLAQGDGVSAKECFERALSLDPGSSGACVGLGEVFFMEGRPEAAKTMYEWGVKNNPASRSALAGLAKANRKLGLPPEHNTLMIEAPSPQASDDQVDVTAVKTESAFARAIDLLFSKVRPRKIIESGTYIGTGTTTIIASAIKRYAIEDAVFYTIEVNPGHHQRAKRNLEENDLLGYVLPLHGLSVPRFLLPTFDEIEQRCVKDVDSTKLYVDHPLDVRAQRYFGETNFDGVPEDLLGTCLKEFAGRPDFVLLDSGGHMGHIEFNYLVSKLKGPCFIALDDVLHVKHHKSYLQMQKDPRFEILIADKEKMGFCIARFTPGPAAVDVPHRNGDLNTLLAGAYSSFERKDFSGALATIAEAEHILIETGALASHSQARVGFENLKGLNYLGLNQLDEARASFEEALRTDPQSSQACAGLGEVFYLAGMDREAKTMYEQAVKHGPHNQFGIAGLAKVNRQLGLPDSDMTLP